MAPSFQQPAAHENFLPTIPPDDLASRIDHTLLKADATRDEVRVLCQEARTHGFASVCVNSSYISWAAECLRGSRVFPVAVVGFPLGAASSEAKAFEAAEAVRAGAQEIDMVIHLGGLKGGDTGYVERDIRRVVEAAKPSSVKVILEVGALTDDQKILACQLARQAGAAFVKTSTGFGPGGATVEDIRLMRRAVGPEMGIKASGGVRTRQDALRMIEAGADRIGTSAGVSIVSLPTTGGEPAPTGY